MAEQVDAGADCGLGSQEIHETRVVSTGPDAGKWIALFERERHEARQGLVRCAGQAEAAQSAPVDPLFIRQLSFKSGCTTASLRERSYARPEQDQYGILVYTAAGDAEGTRGGLVRQGEPPRLAETLLRMTEAAWCLADPLCAEHTSQGFGNLNRAACHAGALLPETGNTPIDRALIVGGDRVPGRLESIVAAVRAAADALEEK
ncbi:hypothetical protein NC315_12275 [Streptomyces sp. G2]|uniref:Zn-binding domain-containing protein n=1 Tax=Streptomyces TaxID=1883 RepID=UPI00202F4830|nr:Zn-binding domain-containing protein [Streptomyces sp. G2]MCM1946147.1 hypothetical protein [Streptomyces sp. G2]